MEELDIRNYEKVIPIIRAADINTMFALAVLERKVEGKVFADAETSPAAFYIRHPYGMALLCGETNREDFYRQLASHMLNSEKVRNEFEWLQVYPAPLYTKMESILETNLIKKNPNEPYKRSVSPEEDKKVLEYQRINFIFKKEKYLTFKNSLMYENYKIEPTSETVFSLMPGSVIPKRFWNNYRDFLKHGTGFTLLLADDFPAATAFASFTIGDRLEIGIETSEKYQGLGFGSLVCAKLIDYCLENGYEPVWSCNSGNIESRKLAHKLGFEEAKRVPYYRLSK